MRIILGNTFFKIILLAWMSIIYYENFWSIFWNLINSFALRYSYTQISLDLSILGQLSENIMQ